MKFLTLLLLFSSSLYAQVITKEYARAIPQGVPNSAVYMTVKNNTNKDVKIVKATSTIAKHIEVHTHENKNGIMSMHQVPYVLIPAHKTVLFKPMSFHIMLIGLKHHLKVGEKFSMTVFFGNGKKIKIQPTVKKL